MHQIFGIADQDRGKSQHTGVIDQDLRVRCLACRLRNLLWIGNVQRDGHDAGIIKFYVCHIARGGINLGDAVLQQSLDNCLADAAVGAGNKGDFMVKLRHYHAPWV